MTSHSPLPHLKQKFPDPPRVSVSGTSILTLQDRYAEAKANLNLEIRGSEHNSSDNIMQVRVFKIEKHY